MAGKKKVVVPPDAWEITMRNADWLRTIDKMLRKHHLRLRFRGAGDRRPIRIWIEAMPDDKKPYGDKHDLVRRSLRHD